MEFWVVRVQFSFSGQITKHASVACNKTVIGKQRPRAKFQISCSTQCKIYGRIYKLALNRLSYVRPTPWQNKEYIGVGTL